MSLASILIATSLLLACGDKDGNDNDDDGDSGATTDGGSADGGSGDGGDGGSGDGGLPDADNDGYPVGEDCVDSDPAINPGADEVCNGKDDNCDGITDDDAIDRQLYYPDADNDGYGNPLAGALLCPARATGYVTNGDDCKDSDANISPDGAEVCDDRDADEDCDGLRDDDDPNTHPDTMYSFFADLDGDGFGDPDNIIMGCDAEDIRSLNQIDCDDTNASVGPDSSCAPFDGSWRGELDVDVDAVYGYSGTCTDSGTVTISDAASNQVSGTITCNYYDYYPVTFSLYGEIEYPWDVSGYWQDTMNWWDGAGGETWFTGQFSEDGQSLTLTLWGEGSFAAYEVTLDGTWMVER